jgi:hypothetical protein
MHREDEVCTEQPRPCPKCGEPTCMRCRAFEDTDLCDGCSEKAFRFSERRAAERANKIGAVG